ncbi:MAG: hypothetical protein HZB62_14440 [Nitrospirae bacterium]|nr:hypothetical protein [Nitrospirota bacterium]
MRKKLFIFAAIVSLLIAAIAFAEVKNGKVDIKVGDELYVCNCGDKCPCDSMSRNAGQCTCGKDMVKAKVTKIEDGKAYFKAAGWEKERAFKTTGQYVCACGPQCKCDMISQNPGKCTCGKEMKKAN